MVPLIADRIDFKRNDPAQQRRGTAELCSGKTDRVPPSAAAPGSALVGQSKQPVPSLERNRLLRVVDYHPELLQEVIANDAVDFGLDGFADAGQIHDANLEFF